MKKALTLRGRLVPNDFKSYMNFNTLRGRYYRVAAAVIAVICIAGGISAAITGIVIKHNMLIITGAAVLFCYFMFFYTQKQSLKKVCMANKKLLLCDYTATVDENGITLSFSGGEEDKKAVMPYRLIHRVYSARDHIFVYVNKSNVIIIPKRGCALSAPELQSALAGLVPAEKLVECI